MNCARKHTLVTGCSSGIGRSTALRLARDGQHVYAGIRKPADGDRPDWTAWSTTPVTAWPARPNWSRSTRSAGSWT